jgi:hypothetical protein
MDTKSSIDKFINKIVIENPINPIFEIYTFLNNNRLTQNIIVYFFKKKIFLHNDLERICNALITLNKHHIHAIMFLNSVTITIHYEVLYHILLTFIKLKVPHNLIKEPIFSFMNKTKTITKDLRDIIPYLDIVNIFPDKICFIINLLVELSNRNKLNIENINKIIQLKQLNNKNGYIEKMVLN